MKELTPRFVPVMRHSIFSSLSEAEEVECKPGKKQRVRRHVHRSIDLIGIWKYQPDPSGRGEKEGWFSPELSDEGWKEVEIPSNFVDIPGLQNFHEPVWFRRGFRWRGRGEARLLFEGVDYLAEVWLNGEKLGEHEGYFCPFYFDVTDKLREENLLAVKVQDPYDRGIRGRGLLMNFLSSKHLVKGILNFHDCRPGDLLDAKTSQSLGSGGIYRPVRLLVTGPVRFDWVFITPELRGDRAKINLDVFLTNRRSSPVDVSLMFEVKEAEKNWTYRLTALPGPNHTSVELELKNPKLWFPWDHPELGTPALYTLHSQILCRGECWDERTDRFGIRTVRLGGELDEKGDERRGPDAYHWYINGRRIFIRGTNYISTEWMSRVTREFYERDVKLLKKANMNMIRVHAHVEPPLLYDVLDEQGIMVWQDFTLQWGYRSDPGFIDKCRRMLAEMIYLHYNHPSVVLWCCHNEPLWIWFRVGNKRLDDELFKTATFIDRSRPVHKASGKGDSHIYLGWYGNVFTKVRKRKDPFPTEFGSQAVPLGFKRWVEDAWPPNWKKWRYHDGQLSILCTYLGSWKKYKSFEDFAMASQLYQAELLKYYVEQFRIKRYKPTGGLLSFQFVNWWPSIAWGVIDHERQPMLGYYALRKAFSPILVCVDWERSVFRKGEEVKLPVWVINDYHTSLGDCEIRWRLLKTRNRVIRGSRIWIIGELYVPWLNFPTFSKPVTVCPGESEGEVLREGSFKVEVLPDCAVKTNEVSFSCTEPVDLRLELELRRGEHVISENSYHFIVR